MNSQCSRDRDQHIQGHELAVKEAQLAWHGSKEQQRANQCARAPWGIPGYTLRVAWPVSLDNGFIPVTPPNTIAFFPYLDRRKPGRQFQVVSSLDKELDFRLRLMGTIGYFRKPSLTPRCYSAFVWAVRYCSCLFTSLWAPREQG